ncbi:hypothetical protein, partial [Candidatus Entotheonella palauensis]|uniref:hypothetical protein n=1 Tax=Candidatus Entotheonella palauensis TaxID=93172 RepID=UPI001C4DDDDD
PAAMHRQNPRIFSWITVVDQQVQEISYAQIQGGFEGAKQMIASIDEMKRAAAPWPTVKSVVQSAARQTVNAGPTAAALGDPVTDAATLAAELRKFSSEVLSGIVASYSSAESAFYNFSEGMNKAYRDSASANTEAEAAITREQAQIDADIKALQSREDDLKSAGSIILGILTLGASTTAQIIKLENQANDLRKEEERHKHELEYYQASLSAFKNAENSTKLASYALDSVQNALQQAANSVDDMVANSSTNLAVMQAYVTQFKEQFAGAVTNAQKLLE